MQTTIIAPCATKVQHHDTPAPTMLPEAPCSVNMKFAVGVTGECAQATGRGATAQEAATNLKATVDATRAAFAPPAPLSREEQVGRLLACGLSKAVAKGDTQLCERLMKGALLVLAGAVEPGNRGGVMAVRSQRDSATWYEVEGRTCSCPDARRHQQDEARYCCKHVCAALFVTKITA